jgi:hypothetical protein
MYNNDFSNTLDNYDENLIDCFCNGFLYVINPGNFFILKPNQVTGKRIKFIEVYIGLIAAQY